MTESRFDLNGWDEFVSMLGGEAELLSSAVAHGALLRRRRVKRAGDLLRLALIYGPGGHSLRMAAALAEAADVASLSDVALMKRVSGSAGWLEALCCQRLALVAHADRGGNGPCLRIRDATTISAPGEGGRYMLHLSYDPQAGRIADFAVTRRPSGESMTRLAADPGDLLIADRAYPQPDAMSALRANGAELLLRLTWKSLRLAGEDGKVIDWTRLLQQAKKGVIDKPVHVLRARGGFTALPMRLVILPKPPAAAAAARKKAKRTNAKKQCKSHDPRTQEAADCLILLTSLPPATASPERLRELYAVRWQIELAFKRLKSILDIGKLPAKRPELVRAWLFAHLLLALLADDIRSAADAIPP